MKTSSKNHFKLHSFRSIFLTALIILIVLDLNAQWTEQTSGTSKTLNDVFFLSELNGYAVGDSGTILHTTNGGVNWDPQSSPVTNNLMSIHFPSDTVGYIAGNKLLKTVDGGTTYF